MQHCQIFRRFSHRFFRKKSGKQSGEKKTNAARYCDGRGVQLLHNRNSPVCLRSRNSVEKHFKAIYGVIIPRTYTCAIRKEEMNLQHYNSHKTENVNKE